ncbi:MAG TPA: nuclease-related domain-containing protein [Clostridia bacterium]|nr:nuclease-related domain-containing protein [Clostridia bacterium]
MAVVIGTSGAWQSVLALAKTAGIVVNEPSDVGIQLARAQKVLSEQDTLARDDLAVQEAALEQKVAERRAAAAQDVARIRARSEQDLAGLNARLENSPSRTPTAATRLWVRMARLSTQAREGAQVRACLRAVLPAERALQDFVADRETEVARRVEGARNVVRGVETLAHSAVLANAIAERAVIRTLATLPDEFVVINDLHLDYDRDLPFENGYLRTAQLDHLLIGPTGIYAIETRNWASTLAADGDESDPILQVARASFLCSRILRDAGCEQIVRSIVACEGAPPTRSGGAHVAVMPTARLLAYAQYGPSLMSFQDVALATSALAEDHRDKL